MTQEITDRRKARVAKKGTRSRQKEESPGPTEKQEKKKACKEVI